MSNSGPTLEQIEAACWLFADVGWSAARIGRHFGVSKTSIMRWVEGGRTCACGERMAIPADRCGFCVAEAGLAA